MLIVFGYEPSGHAAAASALECAALARGLSVERVQVAADHHPAAALAIARGYHGLVRGAPRLWGGLYRSRLAHRSLRAVRGAYLKFGGARGLVESVRRRGADVIVCPQASVAAVFAAARACGELDVPVVSVLTDFGVHPFWSDPPADLILVPDGAAAARLAAWGVSPERVRAIGIPIHPEFAAPPSRAQARRALALPVAAPVALVSGGSHGHGCLGAAVEALLQECPCVHVLALCGRNDRLRRRLSRRPEAGARLRVFDPQPPALVAAMLASADVHLGKPGGLSVAESLALGVPMIFLRPLPGQEGENALRLLDVGAAETAETPFDAARKCGKLLDDAPRLSEMSCFARRAGRPTAAAAAVWEIERLGRARREFAAQRLQSRMSSFA